MRGVLIDYTAAIHNNRYQVPDIFLTTFRVREQSMVQQKILCNNNSRRHTPGTLFTISELQEQQ